MPDAMTQFAGARPSSLAATLTPVTEDVLTLDDRVAEVDADAQPHCSFLGEVRIAALHPTKAANCY